MELYIDHLKLINRPLEATVYSRALSQLLTRCSIKYCQANIFNQYLFLTKASVKQAIKSDLSSSSKNCDSAKTNSYSAFTVMQMRLKIWPNNWAAMKDINTKMF